MKRKKVLVLHIFRELEIGGIQSFLYNIYSSISTEVKFDFLVSSKGIFEEDFIKLGSKVFYIPYITKVGPLEYKKQLKQFLCSHPEYQIIHIHFDQLSGLVAQAASECGKKYIICHSHTISNNANIFGKIYKMYLRHKIDRYATNLLACSKNASKWLFKKQSSQAKIIYNGINQKKYYYNEKNRKVIRKKYNINENSVVLGCVGRICKEKNYMFLLKVFEKYLLINENSFLMIVGDGNYKDKIIKYAKNKKILNKIIFTGFTFETEKYYSAMDIFIFPSLHEGLGISVVEAQISGLYCLVSDVLPNEVKITNNISFISLTKKPLHWANCIEEHHFKIARKEIINNLINNNYDIKNVSKDLSKIYLKMWEDMYE